MPVPKVPKAIAKKKQVRPSIQKFRTAKDMQVVIDKYFDECDSRTVQFYHAKSGTTVEVIDPAPYTMAGLARRLGMSREALCDYSRKESFYEIIKEARSRVHENVETRLMEKQAVGAIFNLKNNFGWRDRNETDLTTLGDKIESTVIYRPEKINIEDLIKD